MRRWPRLSASEDGPTIAALHLFAQLVGKVPTAVLPWRNHGWHLTLHLGPRGLATEPVHAESGSFILALDLVDLALVYEDAERRASVPLCATSVAALQARLFTLLADAGHHVRTSPVPNEIEPAIAFAEDRAVRIVAVDSARRLLGALTETDRIFRRFRSAFLGKVSPIHFFWGSFDLAVTRFSGRRAPRHPGGVPHLPDAVTREAYSHEVSSAGFWPGGAGAPGGPFLYAYAWPAPAGFAEARIAPDAARWDEALGEFVLDYEAVRTADDPDAALLAFLESSYAAAADLGGWDRAALECAPGRPGVPRKV